MMRLFLWFIERWHSHPERSARRIKSAVIVLLLVLCTIMAAVETDGIIEGFR